jgi:hypothetical protein
VALNPRGVVSIRRTRLRIVLVLVAAENDDEDDPEAALPRVYSYNVTTPWPHHYPSHTPPIPLQTHTGGSISTSGVGLEGYGRGSGEVTGW